MTLNLSIYTLVRPTSQLAADGTGDWRDQAACGESNAHLFHVADGETRQQTKHRVSAAKTICGGCPVRTECVKEAVDTGDTWGIRGGLTPDDLEPLVSKKRPVGGAA